MNIPPLVQIIRTPTPQPGKSISRDGADPEKRTETEERKLAGMKEAAARLDGLPKPEAFRREMAQRRVAMLVERLKVLQMLLGKSPTPERAAAMAKELKEISKELAKEAKSYGKGGFAFPAAGVAKVPADPGAAVPETSVDAAVPSSASSATSEADQDFAAGRAATEVQPRTPGEDKSPERQAERVVQTNDPDAPLRDGLRGAITLLKDMLGIIRMKIPTGSRQATKDVQDLEKAMSEVTASIDRPMPGSAISAGAILDLRA